MAAMAGLIHHSIAGHTMAAGQALSGPSANPMAAGTTGTDGSSSSSSTSDSSTISANDFLSLLVTEMQNQDPTADTDPNEYINQLVQVNSLEQLIDINQNLSTVLGDAGSTAGSATSASPTSAAKPSAKGASPLSATAPGVAAAQHPGAATAARTARSGQGGTSTAAAINRFASSVGAKPAPGNLSVPANHGASHRVAHALDGHPHTPAIPGKLPPGR
jgi:flagellar basal-body rod modification protein FlgD